MIISALTPLTVALAGKINIITWITGVGYAKLNVYHRYVSYLIFCLATVHVVSPPFFSPIPDHPSIGRTSFWPAACAGVYASGI